MQNLTTIAKGNIDITYNVGHYSYSVAEMLSRPGSPRPRPRPRPRPQKSGLDRSRDQDQGSRYVRNVVV